MFACLQELHQFKKYVLYAILLILQLADANDKGVDQHALMRRPIIAIRGFLECGLYMYFQTLKLGFDAIRVGLSPLGSELLRKSFPL